MNRKRTSSDAAGIVEVVIETPKGSRNKYAYDPAKKAFKLSKVLAEGMMFPYDFGFVPSTKSPDGDPLECSSSWRSLHFYVLPPVPAMGT